jgi:hypothetical protein
VLPSSVRGSSLISIRCGLNRSGLGMRSVRTHRPARPRPPRGRGPSGRATRARTSRSRARWAGRRGRRSRWDRETAVAADSQYVVLELDLKLLAPDTRHVHMDGHGLVRDERIGMGKEPADGAAAGDIAIEIAQPRSQRFPHRQHLLSSRLPGPCAEPSAYYSVARSGLDRVNRTLAGRGRTPRRPGRARRGCRS